VLGKFVLVHNGSTSGHNTGTHKVIWLAISRWFCWFVEAVRQSLLLRLGQKAE